MPTLEKLFEALSILHTANSSPDGLAAAPRLDVQPSAAAQHPPDDKTDFRLSPSNYAALLRLVGSAILDLTPGQAPAQPDLAAPPEPTPSSDAQPKPGSRSVSISDEPHLSGQLCPSPVASLACLFEPAHSMPALEPAHRPIQPHPPLPTTPEPLAEDPEVQARGASTSAAQDLNDSVKFLKLPTEISSRIFREARLLSEDVEAWAPRTSKRATPTASAGAQTDWQGALSDGETDQDDDGEQEPAEMGWPPVDVGQGQLIVQWATTNVLPSLRLGLPGGASNGLKTSGGPLHAQLYGHALGRVAKTLLAMARRTAWEKVHVYNRKQVAKLISLWTLGVPTGWSSGRSGGANEGLERSVNDSCKKFASRNGFGRLAVLTEGACEQVGKKGKDKASEASSVGLVDAGLYVLDMDIRLPISSPGEPLKDLGRRTPPRYSTSLLNSIMSIQKSRRLALANENLPKLIILMPNLQRLVLSLYDNGQKIGEGYGGGLTGLGFGVDGLEGQLLRSICTLKALVSLTIHQMIDFIEIEVLLPSLHELKELRLLGGIQNGDGQTQLDAEVSTHHCALEIFVCHLPSSTSSIPGVSSAQLEWILAPSAGTIREIDLAFWTRSGGPGMWGGMMVEGQDNLHSRWASKTFADLLVMLGPTIQVLALRGNPFIDAAAPSLQFAPHNGSLDYALACCSVLRHLAIDWPVTGPNLLRSLTTPPRPEVIESPEPVTSSPPSPSSNVEDNPIAEGPTGPPNGTLLKTLTLLGRPRHVSAKMLRELLEDGAEDDGQGTIEAFPVLEAITLVDFPTRQVHSIPWPSRELRKLQAVCRERGVWFGITS